MKTVSRIAGIVTLLFVLLLAFSARRTAVGIGWPVPAFAANVSCPAGMQPLASLTYRLTNGDLIQAGCYDQFNGNFMVNGTTTYVSTSATDDTAAIQAAVTNTPAGGSVILPTGIYRVCTGLPIVITKSLKFSGEGWGSNLQLCSTADALTDVLVLRPPAAGILYGNVFEEFSITVQSGTPGRNALVFDGTSNSAYMPIVRHVSIAQVGNCSFYAAGAGAGNGIPHAGVFEHNLFTAANASTCGTMQLLTAGDTLTIEHNKLEGGGYALDITSVAGASTIRFANNNVTNFLGVRFRDNIVGPIIEENEFETTASTTGSNSAMVDLDGSAGSHIWGANITGNRFQMGVGGVAVDAIRLNFTNVSTIRDNYFIRGAAPACDIRVTGNTSGTNVETNLWTSGTPYVCDLGGVTGFAAILDGALTIYRTQHTPMTVGQLPVCAAGSKGQAAVVTDSNTAVWGAVIAAGGANNVLAFCNGANWTVAGK